MGHAARLRRDEFSGRILGKYEVVCRLSTGGMAEIFLAVQRGPEGFQKLAVLKQILPGAKHQGEWVRMFIEEAQTAASFAHPNLAQVYELDKADGELFMAMEFIVGASLLEVLRAAAVAREPIPIGFTLAVCRDTALALGYAHQFEDPLGRAHGVVHRDVSPKNIMVTYEGTTKLLDFGVAKRIHETHTGRLTGTLGYMSPEQLRAAPVDGRSDVFSLGVVLHECLTGAPLFSGRTLKQMIDDPEREPPDPPSLLNADISEAVDAVVLTALEADASRRFPSAREMARGIEAAGGNEIWPAEMCGELVARFFPDRPEQTRELLQGLPPSAQDRGVTTASGRLFAASSTIDEASSLPRISRSFAPNERALPPDAGTLEIAQTLRANWPIRGALAGAAVLVVAGAALWALSNAAPAAKIVDPPPAPRAVLGMATPTAPTAIAVRAPSAPAETALGPTERSVPGVAAGEHGVVPTSAATEVAWLTVDSKPWARIEVDGREIGVTPISHYRLKPGPHALEAVRSDGQHQSLKVRIGPRREEKWLVQW
jgi:serine/threonine protein kinase